MKSTLRDAYNACTWRNCTIFAGLILVSLVGIDAVGFLIWKKFVPPTLIIFTGSIWWAVARMIVNDAFCRVVNAASVGLFIFGLAWYGAAFVDATWFPTTSPAAFSVFVLMLLWVSFHSWRVYRIFAHMPDSQKRIVTESTAVIVAQMTYRVERASQVVAQSEEKLSKLKLVG